MSEVVAVEVEDLEIRRGSVQILSIPELRYEVGEMVAMIGPSGSGKTTLLHAICGLVRPDSGSVELVMADGRRRSADLLDTALVPQAFGLVAALTVSENVELGRKLWRGAGSLRPVDELLGMVGLDGLSERLVRELSGGQQQRVAVARALAVAPKVLVADEPTSELDAGNRERVMELLVGHANAGNLVVVAAHDQAITEYAHRSLALADGLLSNADF
ncbi:ATP-binding cassette domain-containing protein [Ferrimicrobium acidiphilum]|jgi:putative ABC transport system ATP-binding protein|uniref:Sulfate/thiosulfate import ATP-binding protein CysA n=1 Tax=Ferrimicrobium acidiphilum DSM 19497 TaxID=1121877 RepID=A0A0D8FWU0_9ACTN|nr:ATP-binding cassette domain-containing protein [Ferrimicrobium acidiphilum]KJE76707.1 sulfate/thiosulfate import ATP-binding protein CysA [Ferrimicrobium acidiphilum DSM 19497]